MSQGHPAYSRFIPRHGVIVAGPLDGWQYAFLRFEELPGLPADDLWARELFLTMIVRATMPGWPFPTEIRLGNADYGRLQSIKGIRTPQVPVALARREARERAKEKAKK